MRPLVAGPLDQLERRLSDRPFLGGERPMIADCSFYSLVATCRDRLSLPLAAGRPALEAWQARIGARPRIRPLFAYGDMIP